MSLKPKDALITGSSRGITPKLAEAGATIAIHYYQNEAAAKETLRRDHNSASWQRIKVRTLVKRTLVLFSIAGALAGCGFLGPQEQVRQEAGRTTYRAAEDNSLERPDITPVQEKVPGESR